MQHSRLARTVYSHYYSIKELLSRVWFEVLVTIFAIAKPRIVGMVNKI